MPSPKTAVPAGSNLSLAFFNRPASRGHYYIYARSCALAQGWRAPRRGTRIALDRYRHWPVRVRSSARFASSVLSGESFADALSAIIPSVFPSMFIALVRVGEASGTLDHVLEVLDGRARARKASPKAWQMQCAIRPSCCSRLGCVLTFFLLFVLPQFATVLRGLSGKARSHRGVLSRAFRLWCARMALLIAVCVCHSC